MTILIVTDGIKEDVKGGVQELIYQNSKFLQAHGHDVIILTRKLNKEDKNFEKRRGIKIYRFKSPLTNSKIYFLYPLYSAIFGYLTFGQICKKVQLDLINYHSPFPAFGIELFARSSNVKKVFTFHHPKFEEWRLEAQGRGRSLIGKLGSLFIYLMEKYVLGRMDKILVHSDFVAEKAREILKSTPIKIEKIPPGVDIDKFSSDYEKTKVRSELGLPKDKKILLTLRGAGQRHGLEELIHSIKLLVDKRKDILLLIGGKGDLKGRLEGIIESEGLGELIQILGFVEESQLHKFYQAADLFILPTKALEGFGVVILESFATNTPVLGTPVGAIPEVLSNFNENLILSSLSPEDMSKLILTALNDPESIYLEQNYRSKVVANYSWEAANHKYLKSFLNLAKS